MTAAPATIVLVHGAWHDERSWTAVGHHLGDAGVPWRALTLPSTGPGPTGPAPPAGFGADVGAVLALISSVGGPVVLCGHGYGGMVISEAGNHPAVTRLVYLAAFCPLPGESMADLVGWRWPARPLRGPAHRVRHGRSELSAGWARRGLYGDLPAGPASAAVARLRPSAVSVFGARVLRPAWRSKPSLYALCRRDRALGPRQAGAMADRVVRNQIGQARYLERHAVTLDTGHAPFYSAPALVADLVRGRF